MIEKLEALGIDPDGKEADGHLHAELYLSRPKEDSDLPMGRLLGASLAPFQQAAAGAAA